MKQMMAVALILLSFAVTYQPAQAQETEEIPFFLTFVPNIQFSPLYAAIANGHAEAAGLRFRIDHGDEPLGVDLIAAGEYLFGMISGEQVILARGGQRPVVFVYEWFQQYPVGIAIPDTTSAASVTDLTGLIVGIPGRFGASYSGLRAMLAANDLTEDDIRLEEIGFNAPEIVCLGRVDAAVVYINNEPLQIQQRADARQCGDITGVTVLPVADYADMVSNGIVTSEALIAERPELVQTMNAVFDAGLRDVIHNPAQAYLLSVEYVENLPLTDDLRAALETASAAQIDFLATDPDADAISQSRADLLAALMEQFDADLLIQFEVLLTSIELWEADQLGYTDPVSWEVTLERLLADAPGLRVDDLEAAYTNDFLPTIEVTE